MEWAHMLVDAFASVWLARQRSWLIWAAWMIGMALIVITGYEFLLRRWMWMSLADWLTALQGVDVVSPVGWAQVVGLRLVLPLAVGGPAVYWAAGGLLVGWGFGYQRNSVMSDISSCIDWYLHAHLCEIR
jgi:hypothetical protein